MSLRRIKTLYCIAVIAIALILVDAAGVLGWVTAVVVLAGALPMFRAIQWHERRRTLTRLAERAGLSLGHEDNLQFAVSDRDLLTAPQSAEATRAASDQYRRLQG